MIFVLPMPARFLNRRRGTTSGLAVASPPVASAIGDLYRERRLPLVRLAVLMVDDREAAEDLVQDVFIRLHRRYGRDLGAVGDPGAYLVSAVMNAARSMLRRRRIARAYLPPRRGWEPAAEDVALMGIDSTEVIRALARLTIRQRQVIVLRYWSDLSEREIAATLRVSAGTVKSTAHRALAVLRTHLEDK